MGTARYAPPGERGTSMNMRIAENWTDYSIVATGDGYKLERWKDVYLLRPDPQVLWPARRDLFSCPGLNAFYRRSEKGGGGWTHLKEMPAEWTVSYERLGLTFLVKPMGFKHTGLFPEQAVHWEEMTRLIRAGCAARGKDASVKVLNLFAYTGAASVACAKAGAFVTHVDAAKGMVERAGENARLSGVNSGIRYIVDDCLKFVRREIRRGNKYDAIVMDPPSYGRGPGGEMWKIETDLFPFVELCAQLLSDDPVFFLINSYTTGLQPMVLDNILRLTLGERRGHTEAYEVGIRTEEKIALPCGAGGIFIND